MFEKLKDIKDFSVLTQAIIFRTPTPNRTRILNKILESKLEQKNYSLLTHDYAYRLLSVTCCNEPKRR